ncbi:uncharacterized protein K489DRAFT_60914 [Dissoconium aciculare CBS 342.82]|uniref:Uncharacterized protein n=1 Tax=Dissoconium aciculare CBS 342.82 TaxID=1314786 RepID=A0A6J3LVT9_9PEZI|nr:uncharacterized protein K489DRAFT_60914 [Dissoconium aciculare CBS 342.82]KAF1819880.1 hypothetical protein K489DRAFT_60914 [Dissoconium aciculare CBS 342.82]
MVFYFISLSHHSSDIFPAEHGVSWERETYRTAGASGAVAAFCLQTQSLVASIAPCWGWLGRQSFLFNFACLRLLALRFGGDFSPPSQPFKPLGNVRSDQARRPWWKEMAERLFALSLSLLYLVPFLGKFSCSQPGIEEKIINNFSLLLNSLAGSDDLLTITDLLRRSYHRSLAVWLPQAMSLRLSTHTPPCTPIYRDGLYLLHVLAGIKINKNSLAGDVPFA